MPDNLPSLERNLLRESIDQDILRRLNSLAVSPDAEPLSCSWQTQSVQCFWDSASDKVVTFPTIADIFFPKRGRRFHGDLLTSALKGKP